MNNTLLLQVSDLSKTYGSGHTAVHAVRDVRLDIRRGELVLIMGPSGSGKTTLLSMLGGLLRPSHGRIVIDGTDISALDESALPDIRAHKIGFIFQAFNLMEALTVEENILFPAQLRAGGIPSARARAAALIERLNLTHRRTALPATLSGGEKQRVAIACALINRTLRDRRSETHAWAHCPVCRMRVDQWTATIAMEHSGRRYVFCSERCRQRFQENPARFAAPEA